MATEQPKQEIEQATSPFFFEGAEKLLEIWFHKKEEVRGSGDIRDIPRCELEKVLALVNCEVISKVSSTEVDAYVLSESSMFVSADRFILKTCGRTTLLYAVQPLLQLARTHAGFDAVLDVFYSRRRFKRPELQLDVHQDFSKEVEYLDKVFKDETSVAYQIGNLKSDCWHLYTLHPKLSATVCNPDQTLELIMMEPEPAKMQVFYQANGNTARQATENSGIAALLPGAVLDEHLFAPCGYSMNGLLPGGFYFTIHVTPEPEFSYVSFETNIPRKDYAEMINEVLELFCPASYIITLFANEDSEGFGMHDKLMCARSVAGYSRTDHFLSTIKNYRLTYGHFLRDGGYK